MVIEAPPITIPPVVFAANMVAVVPATLVTVKAPSVVTLVASKVRVALAEPAPTPTIRAKAKIPTPKPFNIFFMIYNFISQKRDKLIIISNNKNQYPQLPNNAFKDNPRLHKKHATPLMHL